MKKALRRLDNLKLSEKLELDEKIIKEIINTESQSNLDDIAKLMQESSANLEAVQSNQPTTQGTTLIITHQILNIIKRSSKIATDINSTVLKTAMETLPVFDNTLITAVRVSNELELLQEPTTPDNSINLDSTTQKSRSLESEVD